MSQAYSKVQEFFISLNKDTMHLVDEFYDENIVFRDPLVDIRGRKQMKSYYANLYKNVQSVSWSFSEEIDSPDRCALAWQMTLQAKNFNGNKPVVVDGVSIIKFGGTQGKVVYHRDYFDLGAFVYEGLPILGPMVRFVKGKMAGHQHESISQ